MFTSAHVTQYCNVHLCEFILSEKQREEQRLRKLEEHRKDMEYFAEPPKPEIEYAQANSGKKIM